MNPPLKYLGNDFPALSEHVDSSHFLQQHTAPKLFLVRREKSDLKPVVILSSNLNRFNSKVLGSIPYLHLIFAAYFAISDCGWHEADTLGGYCPFLSQNIKFKNCHFSQEDFKMNNSPQNEKKNKKLTTHSALHQWGLKTELMCRRAKVWPFIPKHECRQGWKSVGRQ